MTQDSKMGIVIVGVTLFLYFCLIPLGIQQPGAEWKTGMDTLENVALSARLFPIILTIIIGVFGASLVFGDLFKKRKMLRGTSQPRMKIEYRTLIIIGVLVGYYFLLSRIGYLYATTVTLGILMYCFRVRNWIRIILVAVIVPLLIYLLIEKIMLVSLPTGIIPMFL